MATGIGALIRVTGCKWCPVESWGFSIVKTPSPCPPYVQIWPDYGPCNAASLAEAAACYATYLTARAACSPGDLSGCEAAAMDAYLSCLDVSSINYQACNTAAENSAAAENAASYAAWQSCLTINPPTENAAIKAYIGPDLFEIITSSPAFKITDVNLNNECQFIVMGQQTSADDPITVIDTIEMNN